MEVIDKYGVFASRILKGRLTPRSDRPDLNPSDFFILDIVEVVASVAFASGDIGLGYNAHLLSPILDRVRAKYHGAITGLNVTLYAQQVVPDAVHVPYVLKALREYDRDYGTAYAADVARLFIRLVHLTARGQRVESTVKTETVRRYLTSLGEFLPEGLKQMLVPEV